MTAARVVVVGLGPAGVDLMLPMARVTFERIPHRYVRTRRHPAAEQLDAYLNPDFTMVDFVNGSSDNIGTVQFVIMTEAIEAPEPHTVVFRLKRPQPSLLLMLASGYSPVYPAHVPLAELRQKCMGTGPFRFKEWQRGQSVELERNPDYFIPDRPYLDGIKYTVITERGTRP